MRTLSFDTSSSVLHVSLLEDRTPVASAEVAPEGGERQEVASLLMPQIDRMMREFAWDKRSLDLVVVGVGPGSFTGIRVAVITARTLGQFLQLPVVGVSLLETYFAAGQALGAFGSSTSAGVILSTTGNQYFYGAFERTSQDPARPVTGPGFDKADVLCQYLPGVAVWVADERGMAQLAGMAAPASAAQPCSEVPDAVGTYRCAAPAAPAADLQPLPFLKNIAAMQGQLAYDRLSLRGLLPDSDNSKERLKETFGWDNVLPLYLRSPSVTVKKDYATPNPPHERS